MLFVYPKTSKPKPFFLETLGGTLTAGLHNLGAKNTGGSKSVGSSTLSGVGFDWDSLGGTDDVNFEFLNQAKKNRKK